MSVLFNILGRLHKRSEHLEHCEFNIQHLNFLSWLFKNGTDLLEILFIFGCQ
jgi:hypothetical protein